MFINVKIISKNLTSLKNFLKNFKNLSNNKTLNFNKFVRVYQKKQNRKIFTILKSPHVNKKAQEQFEYRTYSKTLLVKSYQILKFLILLKYFQKFLHTDVNIKIKFIISKQNKNNDTVLKTLNYIKPPEISKYLLLLHVYGNKKFLMSK